MTVHSRGQQPPERDSAPGGLVGDDALVVVQTLQRYGGHVLDGELDPIELATPPLLESFDGVQDELVEALAAGLEKGYADGLAAHQHTRGYERPAQSAAPSLPAPAVGAHPYDVSAVRHGADGPHLVVSESRDGYRRCS